MTESERRATHGVPPSTREQTVKETLFGLVIATFGAFLLVMVTRMENPSDYMTLFSSGVFGFGLFKVNKKRVKEFLYEIRQFFTSSKGE